MSLETKQVQEIKEETQNENNQQEEQKTVWTTKKKILVALMILLIVVLLVLICLEIAYIADFYKYKDTGVDGRLWTVLQRQRGLFGEAA
ncbi:hypothetical protein [Mycoplasmopsis gallinacea]|uniref:Uncharacterized protein n=1 Tax=Mycoplasmopsis gallinacea TaxID=29556 RepID=A0A449A235_9BACT|nr:hypothetical protein [Mycoplasmopsis gallinacea]VEU58330.1 Uncharacterised protein [Mycoplasmopsis gallinacea]